MDTKKIRRVFDINLLNQTMEKFNATLVDNYDTLNYYTLIKFKCSCDSDEIVEKKFNIIIECTGGAKCKKCIKIQTNERKKASYLSRYGEDNPSKIKEFQDKKIKTFINKYGTSSPCQNEKIKEKIINTNIKKYGVMYTLQNRIVKDKIKNSLFKNYGVYSTFDSKIIKDKMKINIINKYGVENPLQNKEIKEKIKRTNIERYGKENPFSSEIIKEKIKRTNNKKYGVNYPNQNIDIYNKNQIKSKKFKEYKMPSGEIRKVQGYEPWALDELILKYKEEEIITSRKDIPQIKYIIDKVDHYYYPDIYIPNENKIIEIKSTWTIKFKNDNIEQKAIATINKGYIYELWCYDNKKNKTVINY
jgi:hypothetical protein